MAERYNLFGVFGIVCGVDFCGDVNSNNVYQEHDSGVPDLFSTASLYGHRFP